MPRFELGKLVRRVIVVVTVVVLVDVGLAGAMLFAGAKSDQLQRADAIVVHSAQSRPDEILAFLAERVAKWWVPDDVVFVDSLPVGGTGKVQKADLRKQYGSVFS